MKLLACVNFNFNSLLQYFSSSFQDQFYYYQQSLDLETTTIDDLKEKSKKELEELLKIAVQNENYESAAKIRDEISNR